MLLVLIHFIANYYLCGGILDEMFIVSLQKY